jgi:IMP and pyridine-specific 5'-nucleotidase
MRAPRSTSASTHRAGAARGARLAPTAAHRARAPPPAATSPASAPRPDAGEATNGATTPHGDATPADPGYWADLLAAPDLDDTLGPRARSASDAGVLRRKGHLKEQDALIDFMRGMHDTHSAPEVMAKFDAWIEDHRAVWEGGGRGGGVGGVAGGLNRRPPSPFPRPPLQDPLRSRLRRLIPGVGAFFTPLDLTAALSEYDAFFALSRRRHVPPNFAELRHVLNLAQTHASAPGLKLVTFDADGTLYADGAHMRHDAEMVGEGRGGRGGIGWGRIWGRPHAPTPLFLPHQVDLMIDLLEAGIDVAIVTAAGYPGDAARFEHRVQGLLAAFAARDLPASVIDR